MTDTRPKGIGVYCRSLTPTTHGTPAQLARRLSSTGCTFVAFLACWQDRSGPGKTIRQVVPPRDTLRAYADACKLAGVDVWLWGFPWIGRESDYMQAMTSAAASISGGVRGFIHDPEVSYRDKSAPRAPLASRGQGEAVDAAPEADGSRTARCAQTLLELDAQARASLRLDPSGITSYGMADWHSLPWRQLAGDGGLWGSPQLYTVTPAQVDAGLASWRDRGFRRLLPSVPTYGPNSGAKLDAHLARFVDGGGEPTIDGFLVWSYQQTGREEWATLERWAEMLERRAC